MEVPVTDQPPSYPPPGGYEPPPPPPPPGGGYGYGYESQQPVGGGYGYQPPPPAPGAYGYPPGIGYPQQSAGTNGFAIASLACALAGLLCLGTISFLGLIFGVVALNQIKKTGQGGHGLAIAGIVVGGLVTAFWVIMFIAGGISAIFDDNHHRSRYDSAPQHSLVSIVQHQPTSVGLIYSR